MTIVTAWTSRPNVSRRCFERLDRLGLVSRQSVPMSRSRLGLGIIRLVYNPVVCAYCIFVLFVYSVFLQLVLWYCWLDVLPVKTRLPDNLYCVGGDVKPCSINQSASFFSDSDRCLAVNRCWQLLRVWCSFGCLHPIHVGCDAVCWRSSPQHHWTR